MGNLCSKKRTTTTEIINTKTYSLLPLIRSIGKEVDLEWLFKNRSNNQLQDLYVNRFYSKNLPTGFFETCEPLTIVRILHIRYYVRKFLSKNNTN